MSDSVKISSVKLKDDQATKLQKVIDLLPEIVKAADGYDEIFGHRINVESEDHVNVAIRNEILLKFLAADEYDVTAAKARLIKTLKWRKEFQPLHAGYEESHEPELDKLGAVASFDGIESNLKVSTWNFYGNLKSPKKLFEQYGDSDNNNNNDSSLPGSKFLRWRIGLMERSLALVDFTDPENNKIAQIHDYNNVSMLRMDPGMKTATKEIIAIFGDNYPELLSTKFFINVPVLMSWVFGFFAKIGVISEATLKKFQVLSNGDLSSWFGASNLPKDYNGDKETKVESLFAVEKALNSSLTVPEYGDLILKNSSVETNNLSVE